MSKRHLRWSAALGAAAMAVTLTACGGGGATDAADDGVEHVYVEAISADPTALNPQFAGGPIPLRFGFAILGTLVEVNDQYEIMPGLVEEWEFSDDGMTVTLNLREGVQWHDGEPFTAEDVKFNFEEIMPLQTFGKPLSESIASIETPDDTTVILHLASQYGPFLEALSQQAIVPKHVYEGTDYVTNPANMAPIGTGPLMFESFSPGEQVVLVKNPNWWRGDIEVDRAIYPVMTDANARMMALQAGELDAATVDPSQQDQVAASDALELTTRGVFTQMTTLAFNSGVEQLATPELRGLVYAAIDRDAVVDLGLNGLGEPARTVFPDTLAWAQDSSIDFDKLFERDVDEIGKALDAAGYPVGADGTRFTIDVRFISALSDVAAVAEVVKSSLQEVGIGVNLVGTAEPVFMDAVFQQGDFGIMLLRNTVGADPSIGITRWLTCNPNRIPVSNPSGVCDEELDAAAKGALSTLDREQRAEYFHTVQQRAAESVHWLPLAWTNGSNYTVSTARWDGLLNGEGQTNTPAWAELTWVG
ncbi:ABC transporter substrate-binding protein [Microbacterium sp. GXF7504]